jgi:MoaA/NifB/PqqE/SkfB family radical SAM enzyme
VSGPTGSDYRVVQIHPTLRCNLRCRHCYSSSGPNERAAVPFEVTRDALRSAADEGFNALGVSGGEPMMADGLDQLLTAAKDASMVTTITTNGMLLSRERVSALAPIVDEWAVSVDGVEPSHNRLRASRYAFDGMRRGLGALRDMGCRFGLIFTLTLTNLDELEAVAEFALAEGASLLQVHPLEAAGRAASELAPTAPDEDEIAYAFLEIARIKGRFDGALRIHLDAASRAILLADPARGFAIQPAAQTCDIPLAELVSPIVIEADGTVVPLQYGFGRRYALGNLMQEPLPQLAKRWRSTGYPAFLALCRDTYEHHVPGPRSSPYFNWYEAVSVRSARLP